MDMTKSTRWTTGSSRTRGAGLGARTATSGALPHPTQTNCLPRQPILVASAVLFPPRPSAPASVCRALASESRICLSVQDAEGATGGQAQRLRNRTRRVVPHRLKAAPHPAAGRLSATDAVYRRTAPRSQCDKGGYFCKSCEDHNRGSGGAPAPRAFPRRRNRRLTPHASRSSALPPIYS